MFSSSILRRRHRYLRSGDFNKEQHNTRLLYHSQEQEKTLSLRQGISSTKSKSPTSLDNITRVLQRDSDSKESFCSELSWDEECSIAAIDNWETKQAQQMADANDSITSILLQINNLEKQRLDDYTIAGAECADDYQDDWDAQKLYICVQDKSSAIVNRYYVEYQRLLNDLQITILTRDVQLNLLVVQRRNAMALCCVVYPTFPPTLSPSANPTIPIPTLNPSAAPTSNPSATPTSNPSDAPTSNPSHVPTNAPSAHSSETSTPTHWLWSFKEAFPSFFPEDEQKGKGPQRS